jgi:hypothetical protein
MVCSLSLYPYASIINTLQQGFERPKVPSPPSPPRRSERTKETDIDIYTSRNNTEVDIRKTIRSHTAA